jgi:hypothetical protein
MNAIMTTLGQGPWPVAVAGIAAVVCVVAAFIALRSIFASDTEVVDRLGSGTDRSSGGRPPAFANRVVQSLSWLARPTKAVEASRLRLKLIQGGLRRPHAVELFLAAKIVLAVVFTMIFLQVNARLDNRLVFPLDLAIAVWVCGASFMLPNAWLASRTKERKTVIERGLPDARPVWGWTRRFLACPTKSGWPRRWWGPS